MTQDVRRKTQELLYQLKWFRQLLPLGFKAFIKRCLPIWSWQYLKLSFAKKNVYADDERFGQHKGKSQYTLGIISEFAHSHKHYIAACREMDVSYKVLDITGSDWVEVIRNCQCDAFLVWPSPLITIWKQMYDERLKVMVDDMGKMIFPSYDELWMWESKRRMRDWLVAHNVPHPRTWVFFNLDRVKQFLQSARFPVVFKPDFGDCARAVKILRSKKEALRILNKVWTSGLRLPGAHHLDVQWGSALLQEYLPDVNEWRVIRIGESYFGYKKQKRGDFHSGSHGVIFADPPRKLLNLARCITDIGGFRSMSLDIFETVDGHYYINELQTVFGRDPWDHQMEVNGKPGRYVYDQSDRQWSFEEGIFTENACCNLRVECLLEMLAAKKCQV